MKAAPLLEHVNLPLRVDTTTEWLNDEAMMIGAWDSLSSKSRVLSSNPDTLSSNPDPLSSEPERLSSNPGQESSNAETIRQNYLRPLLAQKRIVMTLPNTPNSPQQAYRAAGGQEK